MTFHKLAAFCGALVFLAAGTSPAFAQFEHMIGRVPSDANALVLVNGEKVFSSPVAQKQGWEKNREKMYEAGLAFLPPRAKSGLMASHIDLQLMMPMWELSLFQMDRELDAPGIAQYTGGKLDKLVSTPVVLTQTDAYIVSFADMVVGLMMPADRQKVGRWIRDFSDDTHKPELSPYLAEAYSFAKDDGTPVIMAIDLMDILSYDDVRKAVGESEIAKGESEEQLDEIAKVIASLRGAMFGVTLKDRMYGKIRVDFTQDAAPLTKYGKAVLLRALAKHGASIDEMESWTPKVSGRQLTLEGPLDYSGALRISTLFHRPLSVSDKQMVETSKPNVPMSPETLVRETSKTYYSKVNDLLRDLKIDSRELKTYGNLALWMDKYATRIDQLPVVNVDPELLDYGTKTADTLRQASSSLRRGLAAGGQAARSVETQYNTYSYGQTYGYTYRAGLLGAGYVPYGYSGTVAIPNAVATENLRTKARSGVIDQSVADTRPLLQDLSRQSGEIRKKMSVKYGVEF
ncbi:MAG: hypothetical protein U1A77_22600 [Pirellulales bacterium]